MIGCTSWLVPGTYLQNAQLAVGLVDYVELLVATWDSETHAMLDADIPGLLDLDLQYTVHLPMSSADQAWRAMHYFEQRDFPVLNYVLHPMNDWREYSWNDLVALENLKDVVEPFPRMVFDVGHHLLGIPVPEHLRTHVVEVHAMGVRDGKDHLPLDKGSASTIEPWINERTLLTMEVFSLDGLTESLHAWRTRYA